MPKHSYTVETYYLDKWLRLFEESRDFCLGYVQAKRDYAPRNAYRVVRSDGKIILELKADPNVALGMIAGWPSAEQYEAAAARALACAAEIRKMEKLT